jgi:hypothetical protein
MDANSVTDTGEKVVHRESVVGLWGLLSGTPVGAQPAGEDTSNPMRVVARQADGIPIAFTHYRPSDITGRHPIWMEFVKNYGDIDNVPVGYPMSARHFRVPGFGG